MSQIQRSGFKFLTSACLDSKLASTLGSEIAAEVERYHNVPEDVRETVISWDPDEWQFFVQNEWRLNEITFPDFSSTDAREKIFLEEKQTSLLHF